MPGKKWMEDRMAERKKKYKERIEKWVAEGRPGSRPTPPAVERWSDGHTANTSIGQGYVRVTPLQMTVMMSAVANDGPERSLAARPLPRSLRLCAPGVAESYLEAGRWTSLGRHLRAAAMHCGRAPRTVTTLLTFVRALGVQVGALPPQRHGDHGDPGSQQVPSRSEDWLRLVR